MNEKEIAKAALRLDWENVESQARRVAEFAAEINPVELLEAEFTKCHAPDADPRAVDVLLEALNHALEGHGFKVVALEDAEAIERLAEPVELPEIPRFDLDMDGSMDASEEGRWVRYEDHVSAVEAIAAGPEVQS